MRTWTVVLGILLFGFDCRAQDTYLNVMQRMSSQDAVSIEYAETRNLEFFQEPWHGKGYVHALAPDLMIKEQIEPERIVMAIIKDQLMYLDPDKGVRHQSRMDINNPLTLNISLFKALVTNDSELLESLYRVLFYDNAEGWKMILIPVQDKLSKFKATITGTPGQPATQIEIEQPDGDSSKMTFGKKLFGAEAKAKIDQLVEELTGE